MSIVGTLRIFSEKCVSSPDPGDMVSTEDSSAVFRMLSALGSVEPAFVARAGSALFGTSADGSVAQDPASGILVCANGVPRVPRHARHLAAGASAVLAAYQQWGESFPLHLCGDFSCALWDQPRGRLVLARDHLGNAGLFFRRSDESIVFDSDPREILGGSADTPRDRRGAHGFLSEHASGRGPSSTYFRSIERVLPGQRSCSRVGEGRRHRSVAAGRDWNAATRQP